MTPSKSELAYELAFQEIVEGFLYKDIMTPEKARELLEGQKANGLPESVRRAIHEKVLREYGIFE